MRVLVTAGGTRCYWDEVRWLGNISTGGFAGRVAHACLARGAEVVHLHAADVAPLYQMTVDLRTDPPADFAAIRRTADERHEWWQRYETYTFRDFNGYADRLERLLRTGQFDIAYLAAAVSDYAPTPTTGKLSSEAESTVLHLTRTPKLIARVKDWAPDVFLVGFKLLAGATPEALIAAARAAGKTNRADVTVANDARLARQGRHTIHLVRGDAPAETFAPPEPIAERLVERVCDWFKESRP
jgi:phosphopantothenate-cysteine ligase